MPESAVLLLWLILVSVCWIFYFWLYRYYRLEACRQDLSMFRDRLVADAANREIDVHHPIYDAFRRIIDVGMNASHRIFMAESIFHLLMAPRNTRQVDSYNLAWKANIELFDLVEKEKLNRYWRELHQLIGRHAALGMPIFTVNVLFMANVIPVRVSCFNLYDIGVYFVLLNMSKKQIREITDLVSPEEAVVEA